jgi:hypothetical protein
MTDRNPNTLMVTDAEIATHKEALKGRSRHNKALTNVQHVMTVNKYDEFLEKDTHLSQQSFNSLKDFKRVTKRSEEGRGKSRKGKRGANPEETELIMYLCDKHVFRDMARDKIRSMRVIVDEQEVTINYSAHSGKFTIEHMEDDSEIIKLTSLEIAQIIGKEDLGYRTGDTRKCKSKEKRDRRVKY